MATKPEVPNSFQHRKNRRHMDENYVSGIHMTIDDVKKKHLNQYTAKDVCGPNDSSSPVPHYPRPVEFHVSRIAHETDEMGLDGILDSGGFKGGDVSEFLWWWLLIGLDEISDAEQRYLEKLFPDRSPEEKQKQEPFLLDFTTSPKFEDKSRFGNFRFSLLLADVLQEYSTQICDGQKPVLRIYETIVYKQQIVYSVLIHSPDVDEYDGYPELTDNDEGVCAYRDGEIIWRAQAISETHCCRLIENTLEKQVNVVKGFKEFYMWDHVALVFHLPKGRILQFPPEQLLEALTACDGASPPLNPLIGKAAAERKIQEMKNMKQHPKY